MEIAKGVVADYKDGVASVGAFEGALVLQLKVGALLLPVVAEYKAKLESGEIDPIKGTDIDKMVLVQALDLLAVELAK
jgi:hypothetical protein